ncbi:MAG: NAD(P)/FAD-dependent oxidoreductase [Spirulinaceae cyanobacterium SM2_1_0]|nr:NAD(P)/FAD-dependent oxidoreductase [Spirulinaceae cyanobacterium SM2_1_0]
MQRDRHYDLILIGSGMGALTVASLMAQLRGWRVLLLERHFTLGGFTHSFQRGRFHWDVGVHYVGQMQAGTMPRQLFDLITDGGVEWQRMPEPFEKFVYPGLEFAVYGDPDRYQADLIARFPDEAAAIRRYCRDLPKATSALFLQRLRVNAAWPVQLFTHLGQFWSGFDLKLTTQAYLDRHFRSPELKALLVSQWGDYGLPPAESPFAVHATIALHYLGGGYYPVGGAGTIAASVQPIVEHHGGAVLLNREVTEILLDHGRAAGVRVQTTHHPEAPAEEYFAPCVVSDAGVTNTYLKLVPAAVTIPFREDLRAYVGDRAATTNLALYIGFNTDPRQLGFQGGNHWLYTHLDHNAAYAQRGDWLESGEPPQLYLSFPSLKDPAASAHTAEVLAFTDYASFAQWRDRGWRQRGEDYEALKEQLKARLIATVERHYPGFAAAIAYAELSTPLTNEYLTAHPQGAIYGLPLASDRFQPEQAAWTRVKSPLPGLYLTGADVYMGGIMSALMSGLLTISQLPGGVALPQSFAAAARRAKQGAAATAERRQAAGVAEAQALR